MKTRYCLIVVLLGCWACTNVEDASPSERKTFIRMIEAPRNLSAVSAEQIEGGYVILGTETGLSTNAMLFKTDIFGNEIPTGRTNIPNLIGRALTVGPEGYYVTGDRIQFNPASENLFDLSVSSAMLYRISSTGDTTSYMAYDTASRLKVDFTGSAITMDLDNNIVLLGTFKNPNATAHTQPFITTLNPATLDTVWATRYSVLERDYVNAKAVHITAGGDVVWASALLKETGDLSRTYLSIPFVKSQSVFLNNAVFGETTDQQLFINDIQPAAFGSGYGVIGTYAKPTGVDANMFFMRVDKNGNFITGSDRYFDGAIDDVVTTSGASATDDAGTAITATRDGGFILAGSMTTTPETGNGGKDIFLVKVDGGGNLLWSRIIGGEGDETVGSIRETDDGGLLVCGSNNLSGLSSIFIMKTDNTGQLND